MNAPQTNAPRGQRYLEGVYAPLDQEFAFNTLPVTGEVPKELNGSFYRIGPNQQFQPLGDYHLFAGDGMAHAFHISDGKVAYRNRWVETAKFKLEREHQRAMIDPMNPFNSAEGFTEFVFNDKDGLANTACVWHGGKLLIMEEGHPPFEIDPVSLESIGSFNYDGKLHTAMTAHPKVDPVTGDMLFFAYMASGPFEPDVALHRVSPDGVLLESLTLPTPFPAMVHDFVVTRNYIVLPVFPLTGSLERAMTGAMPFAWEPDKGASVAVIPRQSPSVDATRWIECDPFFAFHFMNGFDQDGIITLDACQFPYAPLFPRADGEMLPDCDPSLHRWTINMNDGAAKVHSHRIDDYLSEFPQCDGRFAMQAYRYGFYTSPEGDGEMYNAVARYDHQSGQVDRYSCGDRAHCFTSEAIFVPRSDTAPEGDGFLLSVVTDMRDNHSSLQIMDAQNISAGPLALAHLAHRGPVGFHGGWRPAE